MSGREHWSEVGYWLWNCHPGQQRTPDCLWYGNTEGEVPVEWAPAASAQTKDGHSINKVLFLFVAAAWNLASCRPDPLESADIYGLWLSYALSFSLQTHCDSAPIFFKVFLYVVFWRQWSKPTVCSNVVLLAFCPPETGEEERILISKAVPSIGLSMSISFSILLCFGHL